MTSLGASNIAPAGLEPRPYRVTAEVGVELNLARFTGQTTCSVPVVLTHGTFSNGATCARFAGYLAQQGFDCWVLEPRGRGKSQRHLPNLTFEAFGLLDAHHGRGQGPHRQRLFLVGHSGGGLAFLMHLARVPAARAATVGLVALASQATEAARTVHGRLMVGLGRVAEGLLDYSRDGRSGSVPRTSRRAS